MQAFSNNVNLNVLVNDNIVGNVTSSSQQGIVLSSGTITVNQPGEFTLKFEQADSPLGNQVSIDNVVWTGLSGDVNLPPSITSIAHNPSEVITSSTTVSVSADVTDTDGTIEVVELHWGTSSGSLGTTIAMSLDAGDTYTSDTSIPVNSNGVTVYYEIEAMDDDADITTSEEYSYTVFDPSTTTLPYSENFEAGLGNIYPYDVAGNSSWSVTSAYAVINGYPNTDAADEDWLVIPGIDFSSYSNVSMEFDLWWQYGNQDAANYLKLYYSTDYSGLGTPGGSSWTELAFTVPVTDQTWTGTSVALAALPSEEVFIAFKYASDDAARAWQIDNISITESSSSVVIPSLFTAVPAGTDQINLSWTENGSGNDVLIAWNSTDTFGTPENGTAYNNADPISGGGTALGTDSDEAYNHTSLTSNTQYFYKIWSVDGSNNYSDGIVANATTYKEEPSNQADSFTATANGIDEINLSWTDNDGVVPSDGFLVLANGTGTFTEPVDGTVQENDFDLSDGAAVLNIDHGTQSCSFSGLTATTTYYFKIFAYTNSGTAINYNLTSAPTDNAVTEEESEYLPLFISEVADPSDDYDYRFVELYNPNETSINLSTGSWYLSKQTGSSLNWSNFALDGIILPHGLFVVAVNVKVADNDMVSGTINGNGDDGYYLFYGGDNAGGTLIDAFGVIDQNGIGQDWFYENCIVYRNNTISAPNTTWTLSEWTFISPGNVADTTPGIHTIGDATTGSEVIDPTGEPSGNFEFPGIGNVRIEIENTEGSNIEVVVSAYNSSYPGAANTYNGYWDISLSGHTFGIDLLFTYNEEDLHGITESNLVIYHFNGNNWDNLGGSVNAGSNQIELLDYTGSFSPFTLGDSEDEPLPITLSSFSATFYSANPHLQWTTMSEINNAGWNIYRNEVIDFSSSMIINLGLISGQGTTSEQTNYDFTDEYPVSEGNIYYYWLESISYSGESDQYGPIMMTVPVDEEEESPDVPDQFGLFPNYPNPFNPTTIIKYNLPQTVIVELAIYNIKGAKIKVLESGIIEAGYHQVSWDGTDKHDQEVSSGVYFYELVTPNFVKSRSMLLIK
ncbi:MAG: T9SS type A sorting domain-containing protein [Candidatus Cloacimonetes bacterium]|nr:T9SS type A sorting domain-containing protein [Candidatus Cloacimonadota bacterium]